MRLTSTTCAVLVALTAGVVTLPAFADEGIIAFTVLKGGWFIRGSAGRGTLSFKGHSYPLSIGGLSAGRVVFGGSKTRFRGTVTNISQPSDIAGAYGAAGVGGAVIVGAQAVVLHNEKGAMLQLTGQHVGSQVNTDLSGLTISLR